MTTALNRHGTILTGAAGADADIHVGTRLMLLWNRGAHSGRITPQRLVEVTAAAPARVVGLRPRKGTVAAASDADIVLLNPEKIVTLSASTPHTRVDDGLAVTGAPETVLCRGEIIISRGAFLARRGRGQFLKRAAAGPAVAP